MICLLSASYFSLTIRRISKGLNNIRLFYIIRPYSVISRNLVFSQEDMFHVIFQSPKSPSAQSVTLFRRSERKNKTT